jgi:hypothetical protein
MARTHVAFRAADDNSARKLPAGGRRRQTPRQRAARKINLLRDVFEVVLARDGDVTPVAWAYVVARLLASASAGLAHIKLAQFWNYPGLTAESLAKYLARFGIDLDNETLLRIIANAKAHGGKPIRNSEIRDRLGLTLDDIIKAKAGLLSWETKEEKAERRKASEKARKQLARKTKATARQRAKHAERERERRAANGARPHRESASRLRPWQQLGISRATWYRKKYCKAETDSCGEGAAVRSRENVRQIRASAARKQSLHIAGCGRAEAVPVVAAVFGPAEATPPIEANGVTPRPPDRIHQAKGG